MSALIIADLCDKHQDCTKVVRTDEEETGEQEEEEEVEQWKEETQDKRSHDDSNWQIEIEEIILFMREQIQTLKTVSVKCVCLFLLAVESSVWF